MMIIKVFPVEGKSGIWCPDHQTPADLIKMPGATRATLEWAVQGLDGRIQMVSGSLMEIIGCFEIDARLEPGHLRYLLTGVCSIASEDGQNVPVRWDRFIERWKRTREIRDQFFATMQSMHDGAAQALDEGRYYDIPASRWPYLLRQQNVLSDEVDAYLYREMEQANLVLGSSKTEDWLLEIAEAIPQNSRTARQIGRLANDLWLDLLAKFRPYFTKRLLWSAKLMATQSSIPSEARRVRQCWVMMLERGVGRRPESRIEQDEELALQLRSIKWAYVDDSVNEELYDGLVEHDDPPLSDFDAAAIIPRYVIDNDLGTMLDEMDSSDQRRSWDEMLDSVPLFAGAAFTRVVYDWYQRHRDALLLGDAPQAYHTLVWIMPKWERVAGRVSLAAVKRELHAMSELYTNESIVDE